MISFNLIKTMSNLIQSIKVNSRNLFNPLKAKLIAIYRKMNSIRDNKSDKTWHQLQFYLKNSRLTIRIVHKYNKIC